MSLGLLQIGSALAQARVEGQAGLWKALAYAGRYGKQPLDALKKLTVEELLTFNREVSAIVQEENAPRGMPED